MNLTSWKSEFWSHEIQPPDPTHIVCMFNDADLAKEIPSLLEQPSYLINKKSIFHFYILRIWITTLNRKVNWRLLIEFCLKQKFGLWLGKVGLG